MLGLELFEAVLTDKCKIAEAVAFENELEDFGYEVVQFPAFGQILILIAVGTCDDAFVRCALFHLASFV